MNKTLINILHIVASVLTVANFIYSIINIDISNNQTETTINNFSNFSVGFRATIAFILEISLASFFGYIIRLISDSIKVNYTRIIYLTIVVFISIWVTNFNSIHILTGTDNLNEWGHWISYIIFFIFAIGIGIFFLYLHLGGDFESDNEFIRKYETDFVTSIVIHVIVFLIIFITSIIDNIG